MSELTGPLDQALYLAGFALAHGVWCVSDDEMLVPFALCESGEQRELTRFAADRLEEGVETARCQIRENAAEAEQAAVVFEAFIRNDGQRVDALIVEAYQYAMTSEPIRVYQPYRPGRLCEGFATLRPKLELPTESTCDRQAAAEVFFQGLVSHEKGAAVWDQSQIDA